MEPSAELCEGDNAPLRCCTSCVAEIKISPLAEVTTTRAMMMMMMELLTAVALLRRTCTRTSHYKRQTAKEKCRNCVKREVRISK